MKFPSISYLKEQAIEAFKRFPIVLISAVVGVATAIYMVEYEKDISEILPYLNLMLTAALGIPMFFCIKIFVEKRKLNNSVLLISRIVAVLLLILLYFSMPDSEDGSAIAVPYIRYTIYNICIHLMVSFAPFISRGEINGFWQYNKVLFLRILTSVLYSGVLYVGLVLALVALDQLFDITIADKTYFKLFIVIGGIFNTWFFLSGIPKDLDALEEDTDYPKGLKIFAQYVLVTLLTVYLVILYTYTGKIILLWNWPEGIVSYLIICVAIVGILAILLIYPFGKEEGNQWIKLFSKAYYFLLVPLIMVLFLAIGMRIGDYGITINRYIIVVLGIWLSLVSLYFIIGRTNIKTIPISLAAITLIISIGPWGMFSISERSQLSRLKDILTEAGILKEGKVKNEVVWTFEKNGVYSLTFDKSGVNEGLISDSLHNEVKSIIDYLETFHGLEALNPWVNQDLVSKIEEYNEGKKKYEKVNEAEVYMEVLGLEYRHIYNYDNSGEFNYSLNQYDSKFSLPITGYDYLSEINYYSSSVNNQYRFQIADNEYKTVVENNVVSLIESQRDTIKFDLNPFIDANNSTDNYNDSKPLDEMTIVSLDSLPRAKLILRNIRVVNSNDSLVLNSYNAYLLLKNGN